MRPGGLRETLNFAYLGVDTAKNPILHNRRTNQISRIRQQYIINKIDIIAIVRNVNSCTPYPSGYTAMCVSKNLRYAQNSINAPANSIYTILPSKRYAGHITPYIYLN